MPPYSDELWIGNATISIPEEYTRPEINVVRCGPRGGYPVVLLHSVGLDLSYWDRQIDALNVEHDVVALDLPGHGRSPGTPEEWTLDHATATVAQVIRDVDAGPAHIVGLSVGGMIAQALALAEPNLIRSLVLIDTSATFDDAGRDGMRKRAALSRSDGMPAVLQSTIERWFTPQTVATRPDIIDRVTKTLLRDDPLIHAAMWRMIAELNFVADLHCIRCPTMILVGEYDPSSPPSAARQIRDSIAGSTMHVIPNCAHMSPLEDPQTINGYLTSFFAGIGSTATPLIADSSW